MGRKMSPPEAEAFTDGDANLLSRKVPISSPHSSKLLSQIAETLGLSEAAFGRYDPLGSSVSEATRETQMAEIALNRDCLDLIEAYTRIADPEERQRLLQIVRDAGGTDAK